MSKHNPKPTTHNPEPTTQNSQPRTHNPQPITHNPEQTTLDELNSELTTQNSPPVECLGMTFENDEARREYFLAKLREKLKDPEFRKIEGFPIGEDEDILAMSDPPYYTACPNPFLSEFVQAHRGLEDPEDPERHALTREVSEGKSGALYTAHGYHTKVAPEAIMRYLLHYTDPGDIVLDGFAGTGMTALAGQLCEGSDEKLRLRIAGEFGADAIQWGSRYVICLDLSPIASFIAGNYVRTMTQKTREDVLTEGDAILRACEGEIGWMFQTTHTGSSEKGKIIYTIWTDVFACPECGGEINYWKSAVDEKGGKVRESFSCPECNCILGKRDLSRVWIHEVDSALGNKTVKVSKAEPVTIVYEFGGKRYEKEPDADDLALLKAIDREVVTDWYPVSQIPKGDKTGDPFNLNVHFVHQFYTKRNLKALARLWRESTRHRMQWTVTGILQRSSKQHQIAISRIGGPKKNEGGKTAGHRRGTLYIPSNQVEFNPLVLLEERVKAAAKVAAYHCSSRDSIVSTGSAASIDIPDNCVDYIFVDPPFGANIQYSELNQVIEAWLDVLTNRESEAVVNKTRGQSLYHYQRGITRCFAEFCRVLKPGHWMTIEFHNSMNSVWVAIQEAIQEAGFIVADVRTLDKQIKTHTQRTAAGSVNRDLVISAYKPNRDLEERFKLDAGTDQGVWDFVRTHLGQLPSFVSTDGFAETIAERQDYLLFDRMVAFHVQRGVTVPLSASDFYSGLAQRFAVRDGMYFLPDQIAEYDKKRMTVKELTQLELFVQDEATAIQWLKQQLLQKPQSFQELHPQFMREIGGWQKFEKPLELREMLEQNFLCYDGKGDVPGPVHSYLSTNFKELRNLDKDNPALQGKAKNRWYVPDPNRAADLEKLRERALLREFWEYLPPGYKPTAKQDDDGYIPGLEPKAPPIPKGKRIKIIRLEAVRVGFKHCWQRQDYRTIIAVAQRIPENVLQEDPKLLMWYDQAITRTEG